MSADDGGAEPIGHPKVGEAGPRVLSDPTTLPYLLTVAEAAELLRTTTKGIYIRIERKLLPGVVRDGRRVLLLRDDVLEYIREKRATSPEKARRCP